LIAAAFTAVIAVTSLRLGGFEIVGKTVPFAYPWRLVVPNAAARLTAWGGYLLHNLVAWFIIYRARREKPGYGNDLRWFNWAMIATNTGAILLHILQTQMFFDGLAADVPELSALGSVAVMLMIVIIFETPRRGLIFGAKFKFKDGFMQIARKYHGYFFSWAIIYTFWYHPTEGTWGHLMGFFYMFMLFVQSALLFNRAHLNKYWTFALEFFVLVHGVTVSVLQGNNTWPMFAFGFGAMLVLTQMYGLGLDSLAKRIVAVVFIAMAVAFYALSGHIAGLNEIIRIPVLDYMFIFVLYGIYLAMHWIINLFTRHPLIEAGAD
jgi:hypothetical protein